MLAIIPAKKKSKRLPNKNIKKINGKPLIAYTIEVAKKSKKISRIIVSTDCPRIARISRKYGAEVPFIRPKKFSSDKADSHEGVIDVCRHVVNFLKDKEGINIRSFIVLQPTSPLKLSKDIDSAISIFKRKKADSVSSFCEAKPKDWYFNLNKDGSLKQSVKKNIKNNKKNKSTYLLNGAIFICKTNFVKKGFGFTRKCFAYLMPKSRSVDIDVIDDFKYAEYLISRNNKKL